jgi:hypothetical protein
MGSMDGTYCLFRSTMVFGTMIDMESENVGIPSFNVLSLCTGYGGVELGLRLAIRNSRVVACVEHEACACEVLTNLRLMR